VATKTFNEKQLQMLRDQFAKVDRIDDEHWKRIQYLLQDSDSRTALVQLRDARIRFLSDIVKHYLERGTLRRL
jgi:hypothetical protein